MQMEIRKDYISNVYVTTQLTGSNNITVDVYFSEDGDYFELETESLRKLQSQSIGNIEVHTELDPETINGAYEYPYKTRVVRLIDSSSLVYVPSIDTFPTASQYYYAPIVFERYNPVVIRNIDTQFRQLTVNIPEISEGGE